MNKRLLIIRLLPVLIIVLAVSAFSYMKSSKPERKKPVATEKVWLVNAVPVQPGSLAPDLTLHGEVETPALLRAAAPGAGQVSRVLVRPGESVKPGQLLVTMDDRDFAAANVQASADVSDIQAQLAELKISYLSNIKVLEQEKKLLVLANKEVKRVERLKKNNLSSESALSDAHEMLGRQELSLLAKQLEVDRYQNTVKQYQARLSRTKARLTETELAIERSKISADFAAVIAEVPVSAGDRVRIADLLVSLYALDSVELRANIPASYQAEIQSALERGDILTANAEMSGSKFQLELLRLAGAARADGIDAYFEVTEGFDRLRIGNLLKVNLQRPVQHNVIAVPYRAIYGNNRVYILREDRMVAVNVEMVG
ncbi:MAG: biotin/lipoyl-binding protein, partial [Gammaproteobacteria bacterium]|nr:biotin/lipoyl-binding protein [Gammaproteobacteria bacterium]